MRFLIAAAGTGGHIFPGLAVAERLIEQGHNVEWIGTKEGLENSILPKYIKLNYIKIAGLRGKNLLSRLKALIFLCVSFLQVIKIFLRFKPDKVLVMGGFVSGPVGIISWIFRVPLIVHEQNSIAGTANRILSKFATVVLEAFPKSFKKVKNIDENKIKTIGNPISNKFKNIISPEIKFNNISNKNNINILVLGGSRGALALNKLIPEFAKIWQDKFENKIILNIKHQTGKNHLELTKQIYEKNNISADIIGFINDMPEAYEFADLVICRAGALTITELTQAGVGSILIPLPNSIDNHQYYNAKFLSDENAGVLLEQKDATAEQILNIIYNLFDNNKLYEMAKKSKHLAEKDSLNEVVKYCCN